MVQAQCKLLEMKKLLKIDIKNRKHVLNKNEIFIIMKFNPKLMSYKRQKVHYILISLMKKWIVEMLQR